MSVGALWISPAWSWHWLQVVEGLRGSPRAWIQARNAAAAVAAAPCIFSSVQVCLNDTVSPHACKWRNCLALLCVCLEEGELKCSTSQLWQLRKLKKECGGGGKRRSSWHDWYTCISEKGNAVRRDSPADATAGYAWGNIVSGPEVCSG